LENNWEIEMVLENLKPSLNKDNYQKKFHELIYLEECENHLNVRQYDMENAHFRREGRYLALSVPGLADGRPSLIVSDKVICYDGHNPNKEKKIAYEGIIHEVIQYILLLFFL
jgi:RNA helicase armi